MLNATAEAPLTTAQATTADHGQPFRLPGSDQHEIVRVISGLVALYSMNARGDRQIVGLQFPGDTITPWTRGRFGIWPLVKSELEVSPAVGAIRSETFDDSRRALLAAHEWLAQLRVSSVERIAHLLCEMAVRGRFGTERMPNLLTQNQLADIVGQTSVNVNRVFADLERRGLIERKERQIIFRDWAALCRLGQFDLNYCGEWL